MIALNTFWTFGYVTILLFVFWTLFILIEKMMRSDHIIRFLLNLLWAGMGTYVFHCVW